MQYPPTPQRKACNCENPCISTDDVYYAGPNLPNSGINTYNVLTSVIEKLDAIYAVPTLQKVTEMGNYTTLPIIADSFVKIGGDGNNILLDDGTVLPIGDLPSPTLPYKVYTALLTQIDAEAPVATVLENTLGGIISWTRDSAGNYIGTLNGAFPLGKTVCFYTHDGWNGSTGYGGLLRSSSNTVWMTFNNPAGEYVDTQGQSDSIEIRVYN